MATAPVLTYTLTNGQNADASQVMHNFDTILGWITSDGIGIDGGAFTTLPTSAVTPSTASQLTTKVYVDQASTTGNAATADLATLATDATTAVNASGNAATATKLFTPRAINGEDFDGTAPITVTAAAGTLTGATLAGVVTASSLTSVGALTDLTATGLVTANGGISAGVAGKVVTLYSDTDWALRIGNLANIKTPDNKAVIGVIFNSAHGSGTPIGMSFMYDSVVTTKTFIKFQYATGVDGGGIQSNGTTLAFVQPSDIRYKENIVAVYGATAALEQVDVISYNRIGHSFTRAGFSAQNVQSIVEFSEFVTPIEGDDDGKLQLAESEFVPYLVKSVQELSGRIAALEAV